MVDLSIIIPTYNEAQRIGSTLEQLSEYIKKHASKYSIEVIVVDLDSPDGTKEVVQKYKDSFESLRIISAGPKPPGGFVKGGQVAKGFEQAKGKYVMFMDADLATPLKYMKNVFDLIEQNKPIGICVRNLSVSHKGIRKFVSSIGNIVVRVTLTPGISDTQCGFKLFRADAAKEIFSQQRIISWGFDMEALALARRYNYPVSIIDVPDWHDVVEGSKIGGTSAVKAALQVLPDLVKIKWGLWTGKYRPAQK